MKLPSFNPLGDRGVLIGFENRINHNIAGRVRALAMAVENASYDWVQDVIPSYRCLAVLYEPGAIQYEKARDTLAALESAVDEKAREPGRLFELPTIYGGEKGPDLKLAADHAGLSADQMIEAFAAIEFTIHFLGFLGAQPYLGGLPEELSVPRLSNPRLKVPEGSVGIGGIQAGVITIDQPSGYNYLGRTFMRLYDPSRMPPSPFEPGDRIKFKPIDQKEAISHVGKWPEPMAGRGSS
jgi:inhibitor of KinA